MWILSLLLSAPVFAQSEPAPVAGQDRARELFENGATLYDEGNYEAALVAFNEAKRVYPTAEFDYNIANCHERLGQLPEAVAALNRYRAVAAEDERPTLDRKLAALEQRIAESRQVATVPTPVPVAPLTTTPSVTRSHPRWAAVGLGVGLAALGGAGAGVTWASSRDQLASGDQDAYGTSRALNTASFAGIAAGAGIAAIGFAVPVKKGVTEVGVVPGGVRVGGTF